MSAPHMLWNELMESHLAYFVFGFGALLCARLLRSVEHESCAEGRSGGVRLTLQGRRVVSIEEFRLAAKKRSTRQVPFEKAVSF